MNDYILILIVFFLMFGGMGFFISYQLRKNYNKDIKETILFTSIISLLYTMLFSSISGITHPSILIIVLIGFFPLIKYLVPKYPNIFKIDTEIKTSKSIKDENTWFYESVPSSKLSKSSFQIKYKDSRGNTTDRILDVRRYGSDYILAYCRLRHEVRTFKMNRIIEAIDLETGEFIKNIIHYLDNNSYKEDTLYNDFAVEQLIYYDKFIIKNKSLLYVLIYVVKCDGTFNAKEKAIVKEVLQYLDDKNTKYIDDTFIEKLHKDFILPTFTQFQEYFNDIMINDININIHSTIDRIVSTQKTIHPFEQEVLIYIKDKRPKKEEQKVFKEDGFTIEYNY